MPTDGEPLRGPSPSIKRVSGMQLNTDLGALAREPSTTLVYDLTNIEPIILSNVFA